jgi:ABC-type branched-subunit amino acid transport system ATPase component
MLLRLEGLTVCFGGVEALSGLDLALAPGACLGLMGPNGCGKTTLFNAISGVVRPAGGRILFQGVDIAGLAPHAIARRGVARTFQTARLFAHMSVRDNVAPVTSGVEPGVMTRVLEQVDLTEKGDVLAAELSLGEQRRLEIARALARSPSLILMDEPTAGLNPGETEAMAALIRDAVLPACAVILTEHKPDVIAALCPMAALLDQGRKAVEAPPSELFASPAFRSAYLGIMDGGGVASS